MHPGGYLVSFQLLIALFTVSIEAGYSFSSPLQGISDSGGRYFFAIIDYRRNLSQFGNSSTNPSVAAFTILNFIKKRLAQEFFAFAVFI